MSLRYAATSEERLTSLRQIIAARGFARVLEVHDGLSALVAQGARAERAGVPVEFDAFWISSLTDSATRGLPDAEIVGNAERLRTIDEVMNVSSKPIIVDGDTGGSPTQFEYFVRALERAGCSAVVIEDKVFPKRNSLDASARQTLEDPDAFAQKIARGRAIARSPDFLIVARLESLIAGLSMEDALMRAQKYAAAGADAILIHSKRDTPDEVLTFAARFEAALATRPGPRPYLICVPTSYNLITEDELKARGFQVVIHANHMLRAAHKAMVQASQVILQSGRTFEIDALCSPISTVFSEVGFDAVKLKDREYSRNERLAAIVVGAEKDAAFPELPKSLVEVAGRPILRHQLDTIRQADIPRFTVVGGHAAAMLEPFKREGVKIVHNPVHGETSSLHSLFCAEQEMHGGFILSTAGLLFSAEVVSRLLRAGGDVVLAVGRVVPHADDQPRDLVVSQVRLAENWHTLRPAREMQLARVGRKVDPAAADYEYIGLAYFSEEGSSTLRKIFADCRSRAGALAFQEAPSFERARITDLLQEVVDRGYEVRAIEVAHGWMEIRSQADVAIAARELADRDVA